MGMGGLYGGMLLVADPTGGALQLAPHFLEGTPFANYLLPGLLLLTTVGILEWVSAVLTLVRQRRYPFWVIASGAALTIWITAQVFMIGYLHWFQPLCFAWGLLLLWLGGYAVRKDRLQGDPVL